MKLDEQRALLATGDGVVARLPGIVLVAVPATGNEAKIGELIASCREVGEANPSAPGRTLARRMAGILSAADPDTDLAVCVLSQTEDGVSVILAGDMDLAASSARGEVKLSGRDAATWVDRILEGTLGSCSVSAGGKEAPKRTALYELQGGIVPGTGVTLVAGGHVIGMPSVGGDVPVAAAAVEAPVVAATTPEPEPEPEPEPAAPLAVAAVAGAAVGVAGAGGALDEPLTPEPVAEAPEPPPPSSEPFAAPAPAAMAAAAVADAGGASAPGGKAIGVIVFEDGTSYTLDKDYIIGREPENDAAVVAGRAGPLVVDDAERSISRVHAELRLFGSELQIVDRGSTNGTYVWSDTNADWVRLVPNQVASVRPGGWVAVGSRSFVFEAEGTE
jgi:FHA domain